jgi:predicted PurR-regulated permease PerM
MASSTTNGARTRADAPDAGKAAPDRRPSLTPASLFLVLIVFWILTQIEFVLVLGLFSLLLGTILEGPVRRIEQRHIPRPAAIFAVYAVIIGSLVLAVFLIAPVVADEARTFRQDVPEQISELRQEWATSSNPLLSGVGDDLLGRASDFLDQPQTGMSGDAAQRAIPVITGISTGVIGTLTMLVITFYYLMEKALIRRVIISQLSPARQPRVNRVWEDVENKVGGWMRGQLVLCLIIGTIATVSYGIVGLSFWPLLGLWAGITEIIPIVGPWIGGIPAVIVALTMSWEKALITGGIIIGIQTIENWVLVPRVMKGAVGLTPLTVFLAILTGTQFMGVIGAVLAIPIAASLQVVITDFLDARRGRNDTQNVSGWRWMLARAARAEGESGELFVGRATDRGGMPVATDPDDSSTRVGVTSETMVPSPPTREGEQAPSTADHRWSPSRIGGLKSGERQGRSWAPFRSTSTKAPAMPEGDDRTDSDDPESSTDTPVTRD